MVITMNKNNIKFFILSLFVLIGISSSAMDLKLSVESDVRKQTIDVGDKFIINYILTFEQSEIPPGIPEISAPKKVKGCKIISFDYSNSGQNMSVIRGKRTISYYINYKLILEAEKKGSYKFGPIEIYGVKSNEISYEITENKSERNNNTENIISLDYGNEDIYLEAYLSNPEIYSGMSTEYVVKLFYRINGLDNYERISEPSLDNFEFDESPAVPERQSIEIINGLEYATIVIDRIYLTPQKNGTIKIKNAQYRFEVNNIQYVEDSLFGLMQVTVPNYYDVKVPEVTLNVKKFPQKQPENYLGAVGLFTISAKLASSEIRVGQVVSLTYSVSGTGNITDVELPKIGNTYDSLNISEPYITHREQTIDGNVVGITRFEYTLSASSSGEYFIPPVEFVFFNPETGDFETTVARGFNLVVSESESLDSESYDIF